jgi:hypothetical protein
MPLAFQVGAAVPPRDPNDDVDEKDEEDGGAEDDDRESAIIREPTKINRHRAVRRCDRRRRGRVAR